MFMKVRKIQGRVRQPRFADYFHQNSVLILAGIFAMLLTSTSRASVLSKSNAPAAQLDLVDVDTYTSETKLLIYVLQGLANRSRPRVYVYDWRYEGGNNPAVNSAKKDFGYETLTRQGRSFSASLTSS